ncbi:sensor histidine kinase [Oxalobacteraceae bacterium R-40]|uniref:histidine kinase n=1 Tax=Keguizhuia sedimenti TaxID=3064264 RepID=A0ABU1BV46_9BURK|nr:sensor histidine kinase [Oxalobacteraceae bacterium R-40]
MRLSEFILKNIETILQEWEDFARSIQPAHRDMDAVELRDHAEELLKAIAVDLLTPQSETERDQKAKGKGLRLGSDTAAEIHADTRLNSGFTLDQLVAEYRALRASVLRLWLNEKKTTECYEVEDINRFNEAVDQGLSESLARYSKQAQQARDIFVGVIGHDLRTPLQAIGQGAEFLMRTANDAGVVRVGSRIFNSTNRMSAILDNLLDFTMSRTTGIQLTRRHTDLAALAEQVVEEFRFSNPVRTIRLDTSGDATGYVDPTRMGQVVQNLVSNALQYSPADSDVSVSISGNEDLLSLTVHNHGQAIETNAQKHIFDPLLRYADHHDDKQGNRNLGLGLFIVKEIVSAHLGTIGVTSCPNEGTAFTVRLPKPNEKSVSGCSAFA